MSPVPLKKQSRAGTSTRKRRGEPSDLMVEPMTVRLSVVASGDEENWEMRTEVMMTCGTE
jgi:hypothetical protein